MVTGSVCILAKLERSSPLSSHTNGGTQDTQEKTCHFSKKKEENPHILQKEKPHILQKKKNDKGILAIIVSKDIPHILVMLENLFLSK